MVTKSNDKKKPISLFDPAILVPALGASFG